MKFYDPDPDFTHFYQGDILQNVPFPTWPTFKSGVDEQKWALLRPLRPNQASMKILPNHLLASARSAVVDAFQDPGKSEFIMAVCALRHVMVVTRSCQLDNETRKHVVVAPVTAIDELPETQRSPGKISDLRLGNIPHYVYLPAFGGFRESFADLLKMTSIHRSFLPDDSVRTSLVARMTAEFTMKLQHSLSSHLGTKFGFDHEDDCPQDGIYSCSSCFHAGNPVTKQFFNAGKPFGLCPTCGPSAAFVKLLQA